ncbi:hypothetical protein BDV97DRAFT_392614 [Delphinella strobiligena]|nr:hypothetical protein BDV97DRAFT_392614 [Delphinella strobiligena]
MVCQKSSYFRNALEKDFAESHTGVVDLQDHDKVEVIYALLRHIYGHPYHQPVGVEPDEASPRKELLFHVDAFTAADCYDVLSLRQLINERFPRLMELGLQQSIDDTTKAADMRQSEPSALQDNFNTAIRGVFAHECADHSLQQRVVDFYFPRILELFKKQTFKATLKDTKLLAAALLGKICRSSSAFHRCSSCKLFWKDTSGFNKQCPKCSKFVFERAAFFLEL